MVGLIRLLLIVGAVALVVWLLRSARRAVATPPAHPSGSARNTAAEPEAMQVCARCGVHVPGSEAVAGQRGVYCSAAHRRASEPDQP